MSEQHLNFIKHHLYTILNTFSFSSNFFFICTKKPRQEILTRIWASIQFSNPEKIINVCDDDDDDLALSPFSSTLISGFVVQYKLLSTCLSHCLLLFFVVVIVFNLCSLRSFDTGASDFLSHISRIEEVSMV